MGLELLARFKKYREQNIIKKEELEKQKLDEMKVELDKLKKRRTHLTELNKIQIELENERKAIRDLKPKSRMDKVLDNLSKIEAPQISLKQEEKNKKKI